MDGDKDMLAIVLSYYDMSKDPAKHKVIIKDKTMLQFLAYSLDSENTEIVEKALQTFELLIQNARNLSSIRTVFGIMEAIQATSKRESLSSHLRLLASKLFTILETSAYSHPPSPEGAPYQKRRTASKILTFHVFGLNEVTRNRIEDSLVKVNGVISVVLDVPHQRCTIRAMENTRASSADILVKTLKDDTSLSMALISKNKKNQEVLKFLDIGGDSFKDEQSQDENDLPDYLPEEDPPVKDNAVLSLDRIKLNARGWVRSASAFLQEAFYW